jgi:hypothetical protein
MPGTRTSVSDRLTIGCDCWISRLPIASTDAGTSRLRSARRDAEITSGSSTASGAGAGACANAGSTARHASQHGIRFGEALTSVGGPVKASSSRVA